MKISGSTPMLPPAAAQARATRRLETDPPDQVPAPSTTPEPAQPETPAEIGKPHGLVRAADHSHRSDVAALRQWINHPELRADMALPDLDGEHNGNGFRNAVAGYRSVMPATESSATAEPAPVVNDPAVTSDPPVAEAPVETDPTLPLVDLLS